MQLPFSSVSPIPAPNNQPVSEILASSVNPTEEFRWHVQKWKNDTRHLSSLTAMISHPSYRRIMGMGREGLPLLFRELSERPDHWLVALNAMTGVDPIPEDTPFSEAVKIWLAWGSEKGYLNTGWNGTLISKTTFPDYVVGDIHPPAR
jgi:hypothetical protein